MMHTTDKEWEKTRKMGRFRYSILHGFSFALLFAAISAVWSWATLGNITGQRPRISLLVNGGLAFLFATIAYGTFVWNQNEKRYHKDNQSKDQP